DSHNNSSSCTQTITVNDTTKPVLAGQGADATINCPATPSFTAPTATDNCDANATITSTDSTTAGSCAGNYSVTRTWLATDHCGNVSDPVSQTITVHDNTAPSLVGVPSDTTVQCNAVPSAPTVTAPDACDASPPVTVTESSTQNAEATLCGHYMYTITRTGTAT